MDGEFVAAVWGASIPRDDLLFGLNGFFPSGCCAFLVDLSFRVVREWVRGGGGGVLLYGQTCGH